MKKQFLVATLIGISVIAGSAVVAHERHQDREHDPRQQMRQIFKQLDLDSEQKQAIRSVMHESKDSMTVYHQDMKKLREEMMSLLSSGNLSQDSVDALLAQYQETLQAMAVARSEKHYAVYQLLTEEQREKAQALMSQKAQRMENRDSSERFARMAEKLQLSEQQIADIEPLMAQVRDSRKAVRDVLHGFRDTQRSWFEDGSYSTDKVTELFAATMPEFQERLFAAIDSHHQVFQLLNAEQQAKLLERGGRRFMPPMI